MHGSFLILSDDEVVELLITGELNRKVMRAHPKQEECPCSFIVLSIADIDDLSLESSWRIIIRL